MIDFAGFRRIADEVDLRGLPRPRRPDLPRPYRTWGYPVVPILFLLASVGIVVNALVTDPVNTGVTFGIILAGVPVYYAWRTAAASRGR